MGVGSSSHKRKAAYDPQRKWGLSPAASGSSSQAEAEGATYVVAGHIVASNAAAGGKQQQHDMFLKETLGREAQARAARRANTHDTDVTLKRLLKRDKGGMRAVQEARRFAMMEVAGEKKKGKEKKSRIADGKAEGDVEDSDSESSGTDTDDEEDADGALADRPRPTTTKNAYTARVIKELGFDPTAKSYRGGRHKNNEDEAAEKEESLSRNKIYSEVLFFILSLSARFFAHLHLS
jgi:minichromosome maintenance protein 10